MMDFKVAVGILLIAIALALQVAGVHAAGYYNYSTSYIQEGYYGGSYSGYSGYAPNYALQSYNFYNPVQFIPVQPSNSNFYFAGTYTNPHSNFEWYAYIDPVVDFRYVPASVHSFFCGFSFC